MTPELMDETIACGLIFFWFMVALTIGCLVADYILPHIGPLERYLESLPDFEDDEELYRREMERARRTWARRWRRIRRTVERVIQHGKV